MALNSNFWPEGFGESSGDSLVTSGPWYLDGRVIYLSSVVGNDGNSGFERLQPKATLASAITAVNTNGIIVVAADHSETLTAVQAIAIGGLTIVGAGDSGGEPTAEFIMNSASAILFTIEGDAVEFRNIKFPTNVQTNVQARVQIGAGVPATNTLFKGCRFECTGTDSDAAVDVFDASQLRFEDCTFVVTSATAAGSVGLLVSDILVARFLLQNCTFDGGTGGFGQGGLGFQSAASAISHLRIEGLTLLRGADIALDDDSQGRLNPVTTTGGARIIGGD